MLQVGAALRLIAVQLTADSRVHEGKYPTEIAATIDTTTCLSALSDVGCETF